MKRRNFLRGIIAAPVVITTLGLLMPVKPVLARDLFEFEFVSLGDLLRSTDVGLWMPGDTAVISSYAGR